MLEYNFYELLYQQINSFEFLIRYLNQTQNLDPSLQNKLQKSCLELSELADWIEENYNIGT